MSSVLRMALETACCLGSDGRSCYQVQHHICRRLLVQVSCRHWQGSRKCLPSGGGSARLPCDQRPHVSPTKTVIILELRDQQAQKALDKYLVTLKDGSQMGFQVMGRKVDPRAVQSHLHSASSRSIG